MTKFWPGSSDSEEGLEVLRVDFDFYFQRYKSYFDDYKTNSLNVVCDPVVLMGDEYKKGDNFCENKLRFLIAAQYLGATLFKKRRIAECRDLGCLWEVLTNDLRDEFKRFLLDRKMISFVGADTRRSAFVEFSDFQENVREEILDWIRGDLMVRVREELVEKRHCEEPLEYEKGLLEELEYKLIEVMSSRLEKVKSLKINFDFTCENDYKMIAKMRRMMSFGGDDAFSVSGYVRKNWFIDDGLCHDDCEIPELERRYRGIRSAQVGAKIDVVEEKIKEVEDEGKKVDFKENIKILEHDKWINECWPGEGYEKWGDEMREIRSLTKMELKEEREEALRKRRYDVLTGEKEEFDSVTEPFELAIERENRREEAQENREGRLLVKFFKKFESPEQENSK